MPKYRLTFTSGFITNSSSVIHGFPRELLDHPHVKEFMQKYGVTGGMMPRDVWNRSACTAILVTDEQVKAVQKKMTQTDFEDCSGNLPNMPGLFFVIYGDEYDSIAADLARLIRDNPDIPCDEGSYHSGY